MKNKLVLQKLKDLGLITKSDRISPKAIRLIEGDPDIAQLIVNTTIFLQYNASFKVRLQCILQNISSQPVCATCSTVVRMRENGRYVNTFPKHCSSKCFSGTDEVQAKRASTNIKRYGTANPLLNEEVREKGRQTNLERYGVENVLLSEEFREKARQTNLERYGVENALQSAEIRDKCRQTNLERYGVDNPLLNEEVRERGRQTNLERYGVENVFQSGEFQKKAKEVMLERYGVEHALQSPELRKNFTYTMFDLYGHGHFHSSRIDPDKLNALNDKDWLFEQHHSKQIPISHIADSLGVGWGTVAVRFQEFDIPIINRNTSLFEREITDFVESLTDDIIVNDRMIAAPKELDVVIPSARLAIECNGVFWHSELSGRGGSYHMRKTLDCHDAGYQLIHISDADWLLRRPVMESHIREAIGVCTTTINSSECSIVGLSAREVASFVNDNHAPGNKFGSVRYGLSHNNTLVAVMSFSKSKSSQHEWELVRYATSLNTKVVGGADLLFDVFVMQHSPSSVVLYHDYRWFIPDHIESLGFSLSHNTEPDFTYFERSQKPPVTLIPRGRFQKHKLAKKLKTFDPEKTEWENMVENGYDRIWDCGNGVFVWEAETGS